MKRNYIYFILLIFFIQLSACMFYYPESEHKYTITYNNVNGANNSSNPTTFTLDDKVSLKNISLTGYTFNGWFDASTDGNKVIGWNAGEVTTDVVLWARWTPVASYTITYKNLKGADNTSNPSSFTASENVTLQNISLSGYTFDGWFDAESAGNQVTGWTAGEKSANVELWARWTPRVYKITYKDKGDVAFSGDNSDDLPATHTYGVETTLVNATKTDCNFEGWYKESDCSGVAVISIGAEEITAAITLYAKWPAE